MTSKFTVATDSQIVRNSLRQPLVLIYETLERFIPVVLDTIREQALPFSPYLFSGFVRCHLVKALKNGGYDPEDADEMPLIVSNVPNDGIDFRCGELHLKMLKGPSLPRASSPRREDF